VWFVRDGFVLTVSQLIETIIGTGTYAAGDAVLAEVLALEAKMLVAALVAVLFLRGVSGCSLTCLVSSSAPQRLSASTYTALALRGMVKR
jgi:hypothetical protein